MWTSCGREGREAEEEAAARYRTKNKNPTQRCGEKMLSQILPRQLPACPSRNKVDFCQNKPYFDKNRPYFLTGRWVAAWAKFGSTFFPHIFVWGSCFWFCIPPPPPPLPPAPPAHNLSTHNLLTHNLPSPNRSHTTCPHTTCLQQIAPTQLVSHNLSTHNLSTHNLSSHNLLTHLSSPNRSHTT